MELKRVVVTGVGAISPLGNSAPETWENVKAMYDERDFSQAHLLDKFIKLSDKTEKQCIKL